MPKFEPRVFSAAIVISIVAFLAVTSVFVPARDIGLGNAGESRETSGIKNALDGAGLGVNDKTNVMTASVTPKMKMASLSKSAAVILPQLTLAVTPQSIGQVSSNGLSSAQAMNAVGDRPGAVRAYIQIITNSPGTPLANAAVTQIGHITEVLNPEGLMAVEPVMPSTSDPVLSADAINADLWFLQQSRRLVGDNSEQLRPVLSALVNRAWQVMQQAPKALLILDALDTYLTASDALGNGDVARANLTTYADSMSPCFLAWFVKTSIENVEPPLDFVPDYAGKTLVRKYYEKAGKRETDPLLKRAWYVKARDASMALLLSHPPEVPAFDDCTNYLKAATALGDLNRQSGINAIELLLKNQPLSITRWIARYELADFLTQDGNSESDTRAGFLHFRKLVEESGSVPLNQAVNDPTVDGRTRGLLVCVLGHGYAGTNRLDEAETCYLWVLNNFPYEVHPEETASFGLAAMEDRKNINTPTVGASEYEQYAAAHPVGGYTPVALLAAAGNYARANDTANATRLYQQVLDQFGSNVSLASKARNGLTSVSTIQANGQS